MWLNSRFPIVKGCNWSVIIRNITLNAIYRVTIRFVLVAIFNQKHLMSSLKVVFTLHQECHCLTTVFRIWSSMYRCLQNADSTQIPTSWSCHSQIPASSNYILITGKHLRSSWYDFKISESFIIMTFISHWAFVPFNGIARCNNITPVY